MAWTHTFENGITLRFLADQDATFIAEVISPSDADLSGWSIEVAKRSDPEGATHVEPWVHEWRGNRGYVWEALVDSDEVIVRWIPPQND